MKDHMSPISVVRRARERITDLNRWCVGYTALDEEKEPISPSDPNAVQWCAIGALHAEASDLEEYEMARRLLGSASLAGLNDLEGHQAVLDKFDEAIQLHAQP